MLYYIAPLYLRTFWRYTNAVIINIIISYTLMFSLVLQHCCYVVVCRFVRSLVAFVCQEIKKNIYLLN